MFFRAIVYSSGYPISVLREKDNRQFNNCGIINNGNDWRPNDGDVVLCSLDEEDRCYIMGREKDPANAPKKGIQIGTREDGLKVTTNGRVVTINIDLNQFVMTDEGISLDLESLKLKANGYLLEIKNAAEEDSATLKTEMVENFAAPSQDDTSLVVTHTGEGTATGTLKRKTELSNTTETKWRDTLSEDGKWLIDKLEEIQIGSSGDEPGILGQKQIDLLKKLISWVDGHKHPTPSGPSEQGAHPTHGLISTYIPDTDVDELASEEFKLTR